MIKNLYNYKFLLLASLIGCTGANASHWNKKGVEWRPVGAVEIPRKSYTLFGGKGMNSSDATLWNTRAAYMLRLKKNSWKNIRPENCDSDSKRILSEDKTEEFFKSGGKIVINKLSGGDLILRTHIPGPGGLGPAKWIGKAIPWAVTGTLIWMGWVDAKSTVTGSIKQPVVKAIASGVMQVGFAYATPNLIPGVEESGKLMITGLSTTFQQIAKDIPAGTIALASKELNGATAHFLMDVVDGAPFIIQATALASDILGAIGEACPWF